MVGYRYSGERGGEELMWAVRLNVDAMTRGEDEETSTRDVTVAALEASVKLGVL